TQLAIYAVRLRSFHSVTGTWLARDPIGYDGGSPNLLQYVAGRPILLSDPFGLAPQQTEQAALAALTAALEAQCDATCKCKPQCTLKECKEEAARIAKALYNTLSQNSGFDILPPWPTWLGGKRDDRYKKVLCWNWAYGFKNAFNLVSGGKCFAIKVEAAEGD